MTIETNHGVAQRLYALAHLNEIRDRRARAGRRAANAAAMNRLTEEQLLADDALEEAERACRDATRAWMRDQPFQEPPSAA